MLAGIDIGGTKCAVTIGNIKDEAVEIINKIKFKTSEYSNPYDVLERLADELEKMQCEGIEAIGISCGGPLDSKNGVIMSPPNLPGWDNIRIKDFFEERFKTKIFLQNDADACAVAEWKFGAAKGLENVVFLTFGTGLGAGLILNGRLYSGTNFMAGEVGHIRLSEFGAVGYGKSGSAEGFCSGGGIAQIGRIKALELLLSGKDCLFCRSYEELDKITAETIARAADSGDLCALEVYRISGRKLGELLSILIDLLNPQMIVIGSVYTRSSHLLKMEMSKVIETETLSVSRKNCIISKAALGDSIGDYAAISVAYYGIKG
mgnify:FL=1